MKVFKTPDVSVKLDDIVALSKTGSSLKIHLWDGSIVQSTQLAPGWDLERYTNQWLELTQQNETTPTDEAE